MNREPKRREGQTRRTFLRKTAAATAGLAGAATAELLPAQARAAPGPLVIAPDAQEPLVQEPPVQWAIEHLRSTLVRRGLEARVQAEPDDPAPLCIGVSSDASPLGRQVMQQADVSFKPGPEAIYLVRNRPRRRPFLLAAGSDVRGLVYALLELADIVECAAKPLAALLKLDQVIQRPFNEIRSVARLFASEVEDKAWFNDRSFWQRYLTELTTQRFNRFSLMLGLGYDFPTDIRDAYFHFAYPFLVAVPGYTVRAAPLPDTDREQNLSRLKFISEETARRGLHFQLGLWTHAYQWVDSPRANYVIEGLSKENHAVYCRDALETLLRACPAISGVTLRIHGESGIAEGSYEFWKTVFDGVARCGRRVELDLHAKGIDDEMIELALATRMPVNISPKFWAEHMGLGYMQGAIRPLEMPPQEESDHGFFAKSAGSRRFLRYGYGDLLKEKRAYGVLHRLWPGTQRLLFWGSPQLAADYGRAASFCGSRGLEWCEPLSFKGRKGSGLAGGRDGYADTSLHPEGGDFEKYLYSYRAWGRHLYDPDCDPEQCGRFLRKQFGAGAQFVEKALSESSGILPLVTTAHCPSAANNNYWPEMYFNMAIVDAKRPHPYGDTLSPKRFGTVSPLDPELFSRIDDFADELLKNAPGPRYSPAWVAARLEAAAAAAEASLVSAGQRVEDSRGAVFRRLSVDVAILCGLGGFFCWKFRAASLFAIYRKTGSAPALTHAVEAYRRARDVWAKMAESAKGIYCSDVTFGPEYFQRGHWVDRLPAIDADLADMERLLRAFDQKTEPRQAATLETVTRAIRAVLNPVSDPNRAGFRGFHEPPKAFRRGEALEIVGEMKRVHAVSRVNAVYLRFRRVNQAETWRAQEMQVQGVTYRAAIPAEYTDSPFPLQYHFECHEASGAAWLFPGLKPGWHGQPCFVVRSA